MSKTTEGSFSPIVGEKLSAIVFVMDYWQLQFDGPTINVFTRLAVHSSDSVVRDGDDQFRNRICEQIAKIVTGVKLAEREALIVTFEDQSSISISLKPEDYSGPEAALVSGLPSGAWVVLR